MAMQLTPAIAYLRHPPAKTDGDAIEAQRAAILTFAESAGYEIMAEFCDASSDSADEIGARRKFAAALEWIRMNDVSTIIVASAESFAGVAVVRQVGCARLQEHGINLISAAGPLSFATNETDCLVRQVLQIASVFDKAISRARLRRPGEPLLTKFDHVRRTRRRYAEMLPEVVKLAKRLHHSTKRAGRHLSLREISTQLASAGFTKKNGKQYHPEEISRMIKGPRPRKPKQRNANTQASSQQ